VDGSAHINLYLQI